MFKRETIDESILVEMEKNLYKNAFVEDTRQQNEKVKAIGLLVTAAENFEKSGLFKEAEAVTRIIESVANDPATTGLTPEKQVANLETTGTPLNLTDAAKADDEEEASKEEDELYELLMNNPEVAKKVSIMVDDENDDEPFYSEMDDLQKMW